VEALRVGRGTPPGLVNPGTRALEAMRSVTSAAYPADPLLRVFRPDPLRSWQPHMRSNDFIRVCSSQWDATHPRMATAFGHAPGDTHFYAVLCWHLPEELADQLRQLLCLNPDAQTYAQLAAREEFTRALRLSEQVREHMLRRYMGLTAMEPKQSDKRFTHTTSDILVAGVRVDGTTPAPAFYSGCAPTNLKADGVISLTKNDPNATKQYDKYANDPKLEYEGETFTEHMFVDKAKKPVVLLAHHKGSIKTVNEFITGVQITDGTHVIVRAVARTHQNANRC